MRNNAINHVDVLGVGGAGIGVDCENIPENLTMPMSNPGFCGCIAELRLQSHFIMLISELIAV